MTTFEQWMKQMIAEIRSLRSLKVIFVIILSLSLCGCGFMVLSAKTNSLKDVIIFDAPTPKFLNVIEEIGEKENFEVNKSVYREGVQDKSLAQVLTIQLKKGAGFGDTYLMSVTGKVNAVGIQFSSLDYGKTWQCEVGTVGNFSAGDEDATLIFWAGFKEKLLQRLKQKYPNDSAIKELAKQPVKVEEIVKPEIKPEVKPKIPVKTDAPTKSQKAKPSSDTYIDEYGNKWYR